MCVDGSASVHNSHGGLLELGPRKNRAFHSAIGLQHASGDQATERSMGGRFFGLLDSTGRLELMEDPVEDEGTIESAYVLMEAIKAVIAN